MFIHLYSSFTDVAGRVYIFFRLTSSFLAGSSPEMHSCYAPFVGLHPYPVALQKILAHLYSHGQHVGVEPSVVPVKLPYLRTKKDQNTPPDFHLVSLKHNPRPY